MEQPNFGGAQVVGRGENLSVKHGDDSNLIVWFEMIAEKQGHKSEKAGRPVYEDVPYVHILIPGDKNRQVFTKAKQSHKDRFPEQWAAFENQQEVVHEGTPIEEWPPITRSLAMTYKGLDIHTVENLAAVSDANLGNLGHGAREMRDKAVAYLKAADDGKETARLAKENAELKDDIQSLKDQVAELSKKLSKDGKDSTANRSGSG